MIRRRKSKKGWKIQHQLLVNVGMTHEGTVKALQQAFPGNVHLRPRQKKNWKDTWIWQSCCLDALAAVRRVAPWLITKADHAALAIEFYEKTFLQRNRRIVTKELFDMREDYAARMALLNLKGSQTTAVASQDARTSDKGLPKGV